MRGRLAWLAWLAVGWAAAAGTALAAAIETAPAAQVLFSVPEADTLEPGLIRAEWNYTFLRGNHHDRVFNTDQTIGTRTNHRKTHLVAWRLRYGLTDRLQPEAEVVYKAYRQHAHGDGDTHDRFDDGDFERLFAGLSVQALRESAHLPALRLRGGVLAPRRAETENIGQETGFDLLASSSKAFGGVRLFSSAGFAMTVGNRDHPADSVFNDTLISKGHGLRTLTYGVGAAAPLSDRWQANLELDGRVFDAIQLNRRIHKSQLTLTPGLVYRKAFPRRETWCGLGFPIGIIRAHESLIHDTDYFGVSIRTGIVF